MLPYQQGEDVNEDAEQQDTGVQSLLRRLVLQAAREATKRCVVRLKAMTAGRAQSLVIGRCQMKAAVIQSLKTVFPDDGHQAGGQLLPQLDRYLAWRLYAGRHDVPDHQTV